MGALVTLLFFLSLEVDSDTVRKLSNLWPPPVCISVVMTTDFNKVSKGCTKCRN